MGRKIALVSYFFAVGFILALALYVPSKQMVAAGEPVVSPSLDLNDRPAF